MLEVRNVGKSFGSHVALKRVNFTVPAGRMVGFVGANGAGKTTTMRCIMGLLQPTTGEVFFDGAPITAEQRARIGYMPEERGLYPKQPLDGQLAYLGQLRGMDRTSALSVARSELERFGLGDRVKDQLQSLSLGNQQRVQIIASIIGDPICLVLDEPFSGLDPKAVDAMTEVLRDMTSKGVPVLFSSHQLDLVDRLCDEIVVLSDGKIVAQGTSEQLREKAAVRYRMVTSADATWLDSQSTVRHIVRDGEHVTFEVTDPASVETIFAEAARRGGTREFAKLRPTLSELYREVTA